VEPCAAAADLLLDAEALEADMDAALLELLKLSQSIPP